jgi:hypothetical protein
MKKVFLAAAAISLGAAMAFAVSRGLTPTIPSDEPFVVVRTECDFATVARECLEAYEPSVLVLPLDTNSPEVCRAARERLLGGWLLDDSRYCEVLAKLTRERTAGISAGLPTPLFVRGEQSIEGLSTEGFDLVDASICSERWRRMLAGIGDG